jgi:hypothetical protein
MKSFSQRIFQASMSSLIFVVFWQIGWADEPLRVDRRGDSDVRMPIPFDYENAAETRWLKKPVLDSRLLDDMETPATWSYSGPGRMESVTDRCKDGKRSVRLISPTFIEGPGVPLGHVLGHALLRRGFGSEDWSSYNRLSFWVYPTLPGFNTISLLVMLYNNGEVEGGLPTRGPLHYVLLKPNQWNHVVWEIPHLTRNKVTAVEFHYRMQGNEPHATPVVCFDFDRLELQKVDADHYEGWNVAPGRIAFSHTGYRPDGSKTAIASDLPPGNFKLVDAGTGKVVLEKPIRAAKTRLGMYHVLDFTEFRVPGTYLIQSGDLKTQPFRIGHDIWQRTIAKAVNFFYCERCGCEVPGIHKACHADWLMTHGNKKLRIDGGWHDAGDLSQGPCNTSLGSYAMFSLAEALTAQDPTLAKRLSAEAQWGLDWILKTRFEDGFRVGFARMDRWTDGVIGTRDDVTTAAENAVYATRAENHCSVPYTAAATEALAARLLKDSDAPLAARCLKTARDDWQFATRNADKLDVDFASAGALASIELFKTTGERVYADRAVQLADAIVGCQQREAMPWNVPLSGFFYTNTKKDRILHYFHAGHDEAPIVALAELCKTFPDHPNWMKWYSAVVLYSEYLKKLAEFTSPYGMLPASVYRLDECETPWYRDQVKEGIRLADGCYLRLFPVWDTVPQNGRGNSGILLSQAKALSTAARLRKDQKLVDLCETQLQWVVGRNPFCQSLMSGEGYDYCPQYTAMSGNMVGGMPVGIQTCMHRDVPFWPNSTCYVAKETWVFPAGRWLWIMQDLAGLTRDEGSGDVRRNPFTVHVSQEANANGHVAVRARLEGTGRVQLAIRSSNLKIGDGKKEVLLEAGKPQTIRWNAERISAKEPWVVVMVPNGDLSARQELVGGVK